jgi:hypothetical protein
MAAGCRLTKISVFSEAVKAPRSAEWLLHLDPRTEIRKRDERLETVLGDAALDLYRLAPADAPVTWARHAVAKPEVEPFTFRETQRIVIRPRFSGSEAFLLTLLHVRPARSPALDVVKASVDSGRVHVGWSRGGREAALDWDLTRRTVTWKVPPGH